MSNDTCGIRQVRPTLARQECTGQSCRQSVQKEKKGFQNIGSFTLSKRASAFKKKQIEIATDLNDMMTVDELITT